MITPCAPVIRPPWPDEVPRVFDAFPRGRRDAAVHPFVAVATTAGVERIVGVAGIFPHVAAVSGISFTLRPRYFAVCDELLDTAIRCARRVGSRQIVTLDDLADGSPAVLALQRHGFVLHQRLEVWSTPLTHIAERVERVQTRMDKAGRSLTIQIRSLTLADIKAVQHLMAEEGLLAGESVALESRETPSGFSPALSFVVYDGHELVGAILARSTGVATVAIEAEAVARRWRNGLNHAHHLLLRATVTAARNLGAQEFVYTVNASGEIDTGRMARRTHSRLLGERLRLVKDLGA